MGKAILAAIVTFIVGCLGMVAGLELLGGFAELGCIIAVTVIGAFIIYFNDKKSKQIPICRTQSFSITQIFKIRKDITRQ